MMREKGKPRKKDKGLMAGERQGGQVRANLRKERRRRNTFRVGHIETPQMPSCPNRLLPSAALLSTRRISSSIFSKKILCLCLSLPPTSYSLPQLAAFFFAIILPSEACLFHSSSFPLFWPSRFFSHHAFTSTCKPSSL
jgi:hypothetical protein